MKSILLFLSIFLISNYGFAQHTQVAGDKIDGDKVMGDKITIYQKIQKITSTAPDQSLLFLGFQLSDLKSDSAQPASLKVKYTQLNELCINSLKDSHYYTANKNKISNQISEIFRLQQSKFREAFELKAKQDYDTTRKILFLQNIRKLKEISDADSAQETLSYFNHFLLEAWNTDTTYFLASLVNDHFKILIQALTKRLEKTNSQLEIQGLFYTIELFTKENPSSLWEDYILNKVSETIGTLFKNAKIYLGDLLLEGYKSYLLTHKKTPKNPTADDIKDVYKYIFLVSNQGSIERNMIISQIILLQQGDLKCNQTIIDKVKNKSGWSWDEQNLNKIPFVMLNRNMDQFQQESLIHEKILTLNNEYFTIRERAIKLFNDKFDTFAKLGRDRMLKDFTLLDPLLNLGPLKYYDNCNLVHYVYYPNLYHY